MKKLTAWALIMAMAFTHIPAAAAAVTEETVTEEAAAAAEEVTEEAGAAAGKISVCISSEPETLDPTLADGTDTIIYALHQFEGLMKYVPTGEPAADGESGVSLLTVDYGQAESCEVSEDGLTYTFQLRDGIRWSDGREVTAADFEYAWKRMVDPKTAAGYGYLLDGVVENASEIQAEELDPDELGIRAVDEKTLEITLAGRCPYFLDLCCFPALYPVREDVIDACGSAWTDPENLVCNGPYVLSSWVHDSYLEMTANEYYYDPAGGPEVITWYLNADQTSRLAAYQTGEYDFIIDIPTDQIEPLRESGGCFVADQVGTYYLFVNCDVITDWRVRAAICLAIDRDNIVQHVTQGGEEPAYGLISAGITTWDGANWTDICGEILYAALQERYPDYDLTEYDGRCELAEVLLEEAEADGYDLSAAIDYEFNTSDTHKAVAEAVQADLASVLGLHVVLSNQEWNVYTSSLAEGGFGLARLGWTADYDDPITYIELFTEGNSNNYGNYASDTYTRLVSEAKSMEDGQERDELMEEAESMLFDENGFAVCPIYFYKQTFCIADGMERVGWTPLGYFVFSYAEAE